jgi:hypothetical protein
MNHYMLAHLTKNRESDKFRGFSYRKTLKDSKSNSNYYQSKVIAWDVYYSERKLATLDTLKEVKHFISTEASRPGENHVNSPNGIMLRGN